MGGSPNLALNSILKVLVHLNVHQEVIYVLAITSLLGRSFRGHFFLCFWIGRVVRVWSKVLETAVAALGPFFISRGPYKIGDSVRISHVNLAKH